MRMGSLKSKLMKNAKIIIMKGSNFQASLLILAFSFCLTVANAQDGRLYKENHKGSNVLWRTGWLLPENKPDGKWNYYTNEGKIYEIINWKDGEKHGKHIEFYYGKNQVNKVTEYKDGIRDGVYEEYDEQGTLLLKGTFLADSFNGFWEVYNSFHWIDSINGKLKHRLTIELGKLIKAQCYVYNEDSYNPDNFTYRPDLVFHYFEQGPIKSFGKLTTYSLNSFEKEGKWEAFYLTGEKYFEGNYLNNKKEGKWHYYHKNGRLWKTGEYNNDNEVGVWLEYHDNGNLQDSGLYKIHPSYKNERICWGVHKAWYYSGELENETFYDKVPGGIFSISSKSVNYFKNGAIRSLTTKSTEDEYYSNGPRTNEKYVSYYESGPLKIQQTKEAGKETIISYYPNGKVKSIEIKLFNENTKYYSIETGVWKYYNEDGTLQKQEEYENGVLKE